MTGGGPDLDRYVGLNRVFKTELMKPKLTFKFSLLTLSPYRWGLL